MPPKLRWGAWHNGSDDLAKRYLTVEIYAYCARIGINPYADLAQISITNSPTAPQIMVSLQRHDRTHVLNGPHLVPCFRNIHSAIMSGIGPTMGGSGVGAAGSAGRGGGMGMGGGRGGAVSGGGAVGRGGVGVRGRGITIGRGTGRGGTT